MTPKRGEIYYIDTPAGRSGSEQAGRRPAVIVSNDTGNECAGVVTVAFLTTKMKWLPTHVRTAGCQKPSMVLCEQIATVAKERLLTYAGRVSDKELKKIDKALCISLGIEGVEM